MVSWLLGLVWHSLRAPPEMAPESRAVTMRPDDSPDELVPPTDVQAHFLPVDISLGLGLSDMDEGPQPEDTFGVVSHTLASPVAEGRR